MEVIDDDLGRSGSGIARPGFEKLLAAICKGRVRAVVSIEASRLARNGRDWHTLLEFCGLVGTVFAPVPSQIALSVAVDIEPPHHTPTLNRRLPNGCVNSLPTP